MTFIFASDLYFFRILFWKILFIYFLYFQVDDIVGWHFLRITSKPTDVSQSKDSQSNWKWWHVFLQLFVQTSFASICRRFQPYFQQHCIHLLWNLFYCKFGCGVEDIKRCDFTVSWINWYFNILILTNVFFSVFNLDAQKKTPKTVTRRVQRKCQMQSLGFAWDK